MSQLAETLMPRDAAHPTQLRRVAEYISGAFGQTSARVTRQPYQVGAATYCNVIAHLGPDTSERVVVGAHYDAVAGSPGADDNASGVAGLIELARLLDGIALPIGVELVAYTLEEPPFFGTDQMGSAVHAARLREEHVEVRAMLALEMIGYFDDAPRSQGFPLVVLRPFYPSEGNFIVVAGKWGQGRLVRQVKHTMRASTSLPVHAITAPPLLPGLSLSDHRSYWKAGYEAVMITDTAFYRNPHYHTSQDTPETLDYERMGQVVEGVAGAVLALVEPRKT